MLDARPRSFYSVTGAGNNRFTSAREACDDRANGIVASVTGALGFRDCQLHEPLFQFVERSDHVDPKLARTLVTNCYASPPKLLYRPKISPRVPLQQTVRHPSEDSFAQSPRAEYDRGYGGTGRPQAQTWQPQLGASNSARSPSPDRIRTAGRPTAAHDMDVYLVSGAAHLV